MSKPESASAGPVWADSYSNLMMQVDLARQPVANAPRDALVFDGVDDVLLPAGPRFSARWRCPDGAIGATPGIGFVNTGIDLIRDGPYAGNLIVGNFNNSAGSASFVVLPPDGSTILTEIVGTDIDTAFGNSTQDLSIEPGGGSGGADAVWVTDPVNDRILKVDLAASTFGALMIAHTLSYQPNAIAWDPGESALVIGRNTNEPTPTLIEWLDPYASFAQVKTRDLGSSLTLLMDAFAFRSTDPDVLYVSYGGNAIGAGRLRRYDIGRSQSLETWGMARIHAPEGICFSLDGRNLWFCSDQGQHNQTNPPAGDPNENAVYTFTAPDMFRLDQEIHLFGVMSTTPVTGTAIAFSLGDANVDGLSLCLRPGAMRIWGEVGNTGGNIDFPYAIDQKHLFWVRILPGQEAEMWVNNQWLGIQPFIFAGHRAFGIHMGARVRVNGIIQAHAPMEVSAFGVARDGSDRTVIQSLLAAEYGITLA